MFTFMTKQLFWIFKWIRIRDAKSSSQSGGCLLYGFSDVFATPAWCPSWLKGFGSGFGCFVKLVTAGLYSVQFQTKLYPVVECTVYCVLMFQTKLFWTSFNFVFGIPKGLRNIRPFCFDFPAETPKTELRTCKIGAGQIWTFLLGLYSSYALGRR